MRCRLARRLRRGLTRGLGRRRWCQIYELRNLGPSSAVVGRAEDVYGTIATDCYCVAVNCHGVAKEVARSGVGGSQLGHLGVCGAAVGRAEDVGRARVGAGVVVAGGTDHDGAAVDRHGAAEEVVRRGV